MNIRSYLIAAVCSLCLLAVMVLSSPFYYRGESEKTFRDYCRAHGLHYENFDRSHANTGFGYYDVRYDQKPEDVPRTSGYITHFLVTVEWNRHAAVERVFTRNPHALPGTSLSVPYNFDN